MENEERKDLKQPSLAVSIIIVLFLAACFLIQLVTV